MNLLDLYSKDMCHVCGQTPCNCTHIAEEKVRLDPRCWKGKKIGNPKTKVKGGVRVNNCVPAESVAEGYDEDEGNPVMNAIRGRIMRTRPDLLGYDLRQLQAAIRDVALDVGDVDEIGTSDINGWVKRVEQQLSGTGVAEAKADPTSTWVVYNGDRVKRFKTHQGAKAYAEQHGGKVASSAHYADKIQGKQGVAEAFIAPALSAANANAEHRRQGAAGGGYRGRIDIPVQSREDYISAGRALKKAAAAAGQKIEYGLSNGVMSVFSDSMDSDALDQFIDSVLGQGVAEGTAHDPAKLAQGWAQRYPNIDADIAAAKKAIDPNYEYASGSTYQRGKDAQDHLTRLLAIKKIIDDGQPKEQSGLGFGENKEQEADYGDEYQSMVQRVGQRAREQEKTRPVDIQDLARRLRAIEQSKDDK